MPIRFALLCVITLAGGAWAQSPRAPSPASATVFIRVIGTVEVEVEGAFAESTETRDVELGTGSGFVFTPYGHVLTNHHVIENRQFTKRAGSGNANIALSVDRIEVGLPSGVFDATVEAVDAELDLAVLSVASGELPYLALGDSDAAASGDTVQVYGFPFGRRVEVGVADVPDIVPEVSVTNGSVSSTRGDDEGNTAYLQTSATVNPGNSGGPMVDEDGYVLGVVRLKLRDADGIGFAIPVNTVKDFLTFTGYDQLLSVERLHLGPEQSLSDKGIHLRLPDSFEDVSPMRVRAFSDAGQHAILWSSDRVLTPWSLEQLEQALLGGDTFGTFRAEGERRSSPAADGVLLGHASSADRKMEYVLFDGGKEKVVLRYEGPADAVAFNRSVLIGSLQSVSVEPLLRAELQAPLPTQGVLWATARFREPKAPAMVVPDSWGVDTSAPFACEGLPPWTSALATSPDGDFTISLRAGWWERPLDANAAALACSSQRGGMGESSYFYRFEWLGVVYVVEGIFLGALEGTMQLESVAPESKYGFLRDFARAWVDENRTP